MFFWVVEFKFFVIDILLYKIFSFYTYVQLYECEDWYKFVLMFWIFCRVLRAISRWCPWWCWSVCVRTLLLLFARLSACLCVCVCACVSLLVNYDMILVSLQDGLLLVAAATEEALFCRVGISKGSRRNLQGLALESPIEPYVQIVQPVVRWWF